MGVLRRASVEATRATHQRKASGKPTALSRAAIAGGSLGGRSAWTVDLEECVTRQVGEVAASGRAGRALAGIL